MPSIASLKESASSGLQKAAKSVGIETKESDAVDELSDMCPKLSYQQRMIGFCTCFGTGYLITFLSFNFFIDLIDGDPVPFVMVYTLGNILSLLSSMFLSGPKRQFKNMFDKKRKWTTIVYLSSLILSITICFLPIDSMVKLSILILLLLIQLGASIWYSLSYIPFGRKAAKKCFRGAMGMDENV